MFGFMNPGAQALEYRSIYSRLCQHQLQHYGLLSLPFHSYEAVFLYACALDADLFPKSVIVEQKCCRLRRGKGLLTSADVEIGLFCASLTVLLTSIKLQDDIRDGSGLLARSYRWLLRKRIDKAFSYFQSLDPEFNQTVHACIADHLTLEKNAAWSGSVRRYLQPTAEAFAYTFGLLSKVQPSTHLQEFFTSIGFHLGAAIIAFDCASDWKDDQKTGCYNPVKDADSSAEAATICTDELGAIIDLCEVSLGSDSCSVEIARSVRQAVAQTFGVPLETGGAECEGNVVTAKRKKKQESVVLYANCSVPVDQGSNGCCGCGKRAPTYVHLNEGETSAYCCCQLIAGACALIFCLSHSKGGGCK